MALPTSMQGMWFNPSCENPRRAYLYTSRFNIRFYNGKNYIDKNSVILNYEDIYRLGYKGPASPPANPNDFRSTIKSLYDVKKAPDGSLLMHQLPLFVSKSGYDPFANPSNASEVKRYVRCGPDTYAMDEHRYTPEGIAFIEKLDKIQAVCGTTPLQQSTACQDTLFTAFDRNENGGLTPDEIDYAYRVTLFTSFSLGCDIGGEEANGIVQAPDSFSRRALDLADNDQNGALSQQELTRYAEALWALPATAIFTKHVGNLGNFLKFLPRGEIIASCSCLLQNANAQAANTELNSAEENSVTE